MHIKYIARGVPEAPLIVLFDLDREVLKRMVSCVNALAAQKIEAATINDIPGVFSRDGTRLKVVRSETDKGVFVLSEREFHWSLTVRAWDDIAQLLKPFLKFSGKNDRQSKSHYQLLEPQVRLPSSAIPILITTSSDGRW